MRTSGVICAVLLLLVACASAPDAAPSNSAFVAPTESVEDDPSGEPSSEPDASASASAAPTESASEVGGTWDLTGRFEGTCRGGCDQGPAVAFAQSVTAWRGGFAALGREYDGPAIGGEIQDRPRIWLSFDGADWREAPSPSFGVPRVSLVGLVPLREGLMTVGTVTEPSDAGELTHVRAATWVSDDGSSWVERPLPVPPGVSVSSLTHGRRGYAFTAGSEIWFSDDGDTWTSVFDGGEGASFSGVAGGSDGFVATGTRTIPQGDEPPLGEVLVVASGDGRTWHPAAGAPAIMAPTPLGGDWLAVGLEVATIRVWASTDGLTWTRALDVNDLTGPDGPKAGQGLASQITGATLTSADGRAFLSLTFNHCCVTLPAGVGVWSTTDGADWTQVPLEEGALVQSAAAVEEHGTVLVGYLGHAATAALWHESR